MGGIDGAKTGARAQGYAQGDGQPDKSRHVAFAESRQHHQGGANAEKQKKKDEELGGEKLGEHQVRPGALGNVGNHVGHAEHKILQGQ